MTQTRSRSLEGITLFGVTLLLAAIAVVIAIPPARQYELSLYAVYPAYFWAFVVGAMFIGSMIIIASVNRPADRSWVFGLLLVLMTNALLLLMPYIRGYQMYGRNDSMTHLGMVQDIINTGGIASNIYPPMHLLTLAVADATGAEVAMVAMLMPAVFSGVYFGAMFYLLTALFDSRERILFGLPFVMLPVLGHAHVGFRPFDVSLMLVPLVFYLFFKNQRDSVPSVRAAFVVTLLAFLLYHPLTALFIIGVFAFYFVSKYTPGIEKQHATPTNLFSLSAVVFLAWYTTFKGILFRFDNIYFRLFGTEKGEAPVDTYTSTAEEASIALIDLIRVFSFKYGIEFLLFGLGFTFLGLAVLLLFRREYVLDTHLAVFVGAVATFSVGGLFFLLFDFLVPHDRPWQIAKIGAIVLVGQLFYVSRAFAGRARDWKVFRVGLYGSLTVLILLLVILATFSLYQSPLASESNHQVTEMEVEGAGWLSEHEDGTEDLSELGMSYRRFHHASYGTREEPDLFWGTKPPDHFNYTKNVYFGQSFNDSRYMIVSHRGRIVYPEGFPDYPENWRFTPADFERLERDKTADRIYDNGDYNQYKIEGTVNTNPST